MGLTIAVGLYAQQLADGEEDDDMLRESFELLNAVLAENSMPRHDEPRHLHAGEFFEASLVGYGGLHALRRMAAYLALNGTLPPPLPYGAHADDAVLGKFNALHDAYANWSRKSVLMRLFGTRPTKPAFQHLIMHSDAEGFYIPRVFDDVIIDWTTPPRPGLGMMIGSTAMLEEECRTLAREIELPDEFDPDADQFAELLDAPPLEGHPWQRLPIEAHTLAHLLAACEASKSLGAAIHFT
jgi:hypothetical protein